MDEVPAEAIVKDCLNWSGRDFALMQKRIKADTSVEGEVAQRQGNLKILASIFNKHGVPFWLQGRTLLGVYHEGRLLVPDHDDDVGVYNQYFEKVCLDIYPELKKNGFQAIRQEASMLSVLRGDYYIDICFFSFYENTAGYGPKRFPRKHFMQFEECGFVGMAFKVPCDTSTLLGVMYPPVDVPAKPKRSNNKDPSPFKKIKKWLKRGRRWVKNKIRFKTVVRPLYYEEFLTLKIEDDKSINWVLRKPHLDIVTDKGRFRRVGDIIQFLKDREGLETIKQRDVVETPTVTVFEEPMNYNEKLWKKGNNFFFYCIYYGFRKNVIPYEKTNDYIRNISSPPLFSAEYFESLEKMNEAEIACMLKSIPIDCNNGAVLHGKHRVCAMMGRVISGETYVPFYIAEQVKRF